MMLILRDDAVIEVFESPDSPPKWIETIDVENEEYEFCDDCGQRYKGEIFRRKGFFAVDDFRLVPNGYAEIANVLKMIEKAVDIECGDNFLDLDALRRHITKK